MGAGPCARRWRSSAKRTASLRRPWRRAGASRSACKSWPKAWAGAYGHRAYRKAVQFYFPGAEIETTMRVRLCSDDAKPEGLLLKLD